MQLNPTTSPTTPAPRRPLPAAPTPLPVVWSLTQQRTGALLLRLTAMPGRPGLSPAAVRLSALTQARRHAASGEKILVTVGEEELYLYSRGGYQVRCGGCRKWTTPAKSGKTSFCGRCRRIRRERAEKRKAARVEATRRQLRLKFTDGDGDGPGEGASASVP